MNEEVLEYKMNGILDTIGDFFSNIWDSINGILLNYMDQNTVYVFVGALVLIVGLFVILAFINRDAK